MRTSTNTSVLLAAAMATAAAAAASSNPNNCTQGLYMIVARGTGEPAGVGSMGVVANQVAAQIPGSKVVAVDYAATFDDYLGSEYGGAKDLVTLVTDYHADCPEGKMALFGYSQVSSHFHSGGREHGLFCADAMDDANAPDQMMRQTG
jgi:acetylxylan esterase